MPTSPANRLMPTLRRVVLAGTVSDRTDGQLLGAFVADRDADAFAGLVRRHGPMVLGVCRRVTGDHTSADDAFQAVFLVLARRAAAIKPREQVGNWLYGVAYRTAIKARAVLARRRSREKQVDVMPEPPVPPADAWSDLQPVIDEELARLPDKLRMPIVLCDLEGRTQREVAKHLGVPPATLATRLATARRTLAQRLTRRGVTLSGGALAGLLTTHGTAAAVSQSLAYGLAQAAEAIAGGSLATSLVSPHAIQLSEGVIRMMFLTKLKTVTIAVLTVATLTCGMGLGLVPAAAGSDPVPAPTGKSAVATAPSAGSPPVKVNAEEFNIVINERNFDVPLEVDDATFLRRLMLDLCGDLPTPVEMWFFIADQDADKRAKVLAWMTQDEALLALLAKKLDVSPDRIRVLRLKTAKEGKAIMLVAVAAEGEEKENQPALYNLYRRQRLVVSPGDQPTDELVQLWTANELFSLNDKTIRVWDASSGKQLELKKKLQRRFLVDEAKSAGVAGRETSFLLQAIQAEEKSADSFWVELGLEPDGFPDVFIAGQGLVELGNAVAANSDAEFLKRVLRDVRGTPPTTLEEKYFSEDKDPKKREKLLDTLLKDPAVTKKLGEAWKKKMLEGPDANPAKQPLQLQWKLVDPKGLNWYVVPDAPKTPKAPQPPTPPAKPKESELNFYFKIEPAPLKAPQPPAQPAKPKEGEFFFKIEPATPKAPQPPAQPAKPAAPQPPAQPLQIEIQDGVLRIPASPKAPQPPVASLPAAPHSKRLEKLVGELLAAKKTDAEMLEAVTLATVGRLPTDAEKRLTLGLVTRTTDRQAAWVEVAKALSGSEEGKKPQ